MRMFSKEEIKELFAETNKAIAETNKTIDRLAERQEKTEESINRFDERMDRLAESQEKTEESINRFDERMDRLAASQEKTDAQIAELKESQKKTDAQLAKTDAMLNNLGVKMDKMNERYGGVSNNIGRASEQLFFNILTDNPFLKQIRFDRPQRNWHNEVGKREDEYDIVMKNDDLFSIFILEVKFKATKVDIEKLLTTKKENFNILFPKYKDYDQHWGLAATIIDEDLREMAMARGLTVLEYKGELIQHNPPSAPKEPWERQLIGA